MFPMRAKAADLLSGVGQWGVGIKGGTEAAVHAVRLALCQLSPLSLEHPEQLEAGQPEQHHFNLAIATDVSNAFGEIHRAPIFRVIKEEMPELFEVARLFYGQDTHLWFELDTPAGQPRSANFLIRW